MRPCDFPPEIRAALERLVRGRAEYLTQAARGEAAMREARQSAAATIPLVVKSLRLAEGLLVPDSIEVFAMAGVTEAELRDDVARMRTHLRALREMAGPYEAPAAPEDEPPAESTRPRLSLLPPSDPPVG